MNSLVRKMLYYVCIVVGFYLLGCLKVVTNEKWGGGRVEKLASVRRLYRIVVIDVCLFFYEAVVFSATYFCFLFVELN